MFEYKKLCLGGGGVQGFQILGALGFLMDTKINLSKFEEFIGTSIGGVICFLIAIGYHPLEIVTKIVMSKIFDKLKIIDIVGMVQKAGATSFSPLHEFMEVLTIEKIGKLPTMESLYQDFGKKLTVVTYNITNRKAEFLSKESHPSLPCLTALRMSSTLPFVFEPYLYDGAYYIDGGVINNFPIISLSDDPGKTIAINLTSNKEDFYNPKRDNFNPISYALAVLGLAIDEITESNVKFAKDNDKFISLIQIERTSNNPFAISLNVSEKLDLFSAGYNSAKDQFLNF